MKESLQSTGALVATLPEYGLRERGLTLPERSSMNVAFGGHGLGCVKKSTRRIK
jgi:hypothetical protein